MINALRGRVGEFGFVAPQSVAHASKMGAWVRSPDCSLPEAAQAMCLILVEMIDRLSEQISQLNVEIASRARRDETSRRLMTIPGFGPIIATAVETMAPPANVFKRGRDFAAWMGLTPRQHSSGGKVRLGRTSKMGHRDLRRLLIIGASAVVRWASRRRERTSPWLARMLERKPPMLVIMALANKMARIVWALMAKGSVYRTGHGTVR
jgi:transposase